MLGCSKPLKPYVSSTTTTAPYGLFTYSGEIPNYSELSSSYILKEIEELHFKTREKFSYSAETIENWDSKMKGDCDDFAIKIHLELARMGIDSRLAYVKYHRNGLKEGHLITIVDNYAFDVNKPYLTLVDRLPYEFVSSGRLDSFNWKKTYLKSSK